LYWIATDKNPITKWGCKNFIYDPHCSKQKNRKDKNYEILAQQFNFPHHQIEKLFIVTTFSLSELK